MNIKHLKRRLSVLERRPVGGGGGNDTFLAELSHEHLVNLALDLNALAEQSEDQQPCWPEWLDKPSEEEREAIQERFRALERQRGAKEASARTTTRDLLVVALLDSSSDGLRYADDPTSS